MMVGMPTNQKALLVTDARLAGGLGGGVWLTCIGRNSDSLFWFRRSRWLKNSAAISEM